MIGDHVLDLVEDLEDVAGMVMAGAAVTDGFAMDGIFLVIKSEGGEVCAL